MKYIETQSIYFF